MSPEAAGWPSILECRDVLIVLGKNIMYWEWYWENALFSSVLGNVLEF